MFKKIGTVSLFVEDQQRAKKFYTELLGFELRNDAELYPGSENRWIAVAPADAATELILYKIDENWQHYKAVIGKPQNITLHVDDVQALYNNLKSKGVKFTNEPDPQPWGTFVTMVDSEGNHVLVVQNS